MTDYGRVFRMTVELDPIYGPLSSGTFMVLGRHEDALVRAKVKDWRYTICLAGHGVWSNGLVQPGAIIPVKIDDPRVEWLTP